jgi:prepilin-type N-terminal cleavage/methylation domain-containing protein/prepilin-type processing-associated H-X9-DG protein
MVHCDNLKPYLERINLMKITSNTIGSRGFTVVELLVSIAVIGIVASLLLLAVQSARESMRNTTCVSNQRQIGIALTAYETTFRVIPPCVLEEVTPTGPIPSEFHSANARLLMFLDEAPLYHSISFEGNADRSHEYKTPTPPIFKCPSESKSTSRSFNYCYSIGVKSKPSKNFKLHESESEGAFSMSFEALGAGNSGLSGLILLSERSIGSNASLKRFLGDNGDHVPFEKGNGKRDWFSIFAPGEPQGGFFTPNQWTQLCSTMLDRRPTWLTRTGGMWVAGEDAYFNEIMTPNSQIPDCGMVVMVMSGCRTARSEHRSQVNVLFGDGRVASVDDGIDLNIWRDMGSKVKKYEIAVE